MHAKPQNACMFLYTLFVFARTRPYNELSAIPRGMLETERTLKKAISASRVLAGLRASGRLVPNQVVLLRSVLLQEAKASSEIENVVTTNDKLYRVAGVSSSELDPATREVLGYSEALWHGYESLHDGGLLGAELVIVVASTINQQNTISFREGEGCRIVNSRTGETVYTPPTGSGRILSMVEELCEFVNDSKDDIDPLIKMAAAHYQFEAIHPFPDGNGRTGRVLSILHLTQQGLLDLPILYLSKHILRNRPRYYDLIRGVTERARWEDWIIFMLEAVEETAESTHRVLKQVVTAAEKAAGVARVGMRRGYSRELIDVVFSQPYTRVSAVVEAGIAQRNAASIYLRELEKIGILQSLKVGREVLYFNSSLAAALEISLAE